MGITFEAPKGWHQINSQYAWSPSDTGIPRVGMNSASAGSGFQPQSVLPSNSQVVQASTVNLGWGSGTTFLIRATQTTPQGGTVQTLENHVVIQVGPVAYDFYAVATSADELNYLQPTLQHMLNSVKLTTPTPTVTSP